ncbi:Deoxyribonuclease NucA/NucB [Kibdelosporangium aridum]|uniref:Deoxyribonuclease NucA/NucB n=1 Tax=Kibdelosporangium aridum TaxID=2030 RepID=A0A1W2B0E7_KIBAR|nr:Deoxyribonuclease NucA/NucB [Kibdelosporangium aridum]
MRCTAALTRTSSTECDEYPFASTYQNAAYVDGKTQYSFAVRPITATHNLAGSGLIADWYGREHMLDGDKFFVVVR